MHDPFQHATLGVGVFYRDPWAALEWLERAFGFRRSMLVTEPSGRLAHSEMRFGDAYIIVDHEWADDIASPLRSVARIHNAYISSCPAAWTSIANGHVWLEPRSRRSLPINFMASAPTGHVIRKAMCGPLQRPYGMSRATKRSD